MLDLWEIETSYKELGYTAICGADEAGAGPLAGRLYGAAVILPFALELPYLNDSKKVTEKRREVLFDLICEKAIAYHITWAEPEKIDEINIFNARMAVMGRAIEGLNPQSDFALIDGNKNRGIEAPNIPIIKGDSKSASIAAASILAKVARDRYMLEMAELYPQYAFHQHKGYPTKLHYERLKEFGASPIHRQSFNLKL